MTDAVMDGPRHCGLCGVPIVRPETMIEVAGRFYPSASCAWLAENPDLALRMRRSGGMVQTCGLCYAPIVVSEIMVLQDGFTYCCPNCAAVARTGAAPAVAGGPPVAGAASSR
ncbi:MAG: hypothetical protein IT340_03380 [Chloroflexi bacterium]|nr:hypothetical protein [Chloroflexota bacterium]